MFLRKVFFFCNSAADTQFPVPVCKHLITQFQESFKSVYLGNDSIF